MTQFLAWSTYENPVVANETTNFVEHKEQLKDNSSIYCKEFREQTTTIFKPFEFLLLSQRNDLNMLKSSWKVFQPVEIHHFRLQWQLVCRRVGAALDDRTIEPTIKHVGESIMASEGPGNYI